MTARFPRSLPLPPPLQAAIYARVSSDQQAERHTIDSQISDLKAHAAQDGHAVPDEYLFIDNGVSGTGLIRPALERLRDLIALSAIDLVYVHAPTASPAATLTR
jgi:site-specific DNA recombinase